MADLRLDLYGDLPFLNDTNRQLEVDIKLKTLKSQQLEQDLLQQENRNTAIIEHSKNLDFQIKNQHQFLIDKDKTYLTEVDLNALGQVEINRILKQVANSKEEQIKINENLAWHQQEISKIEEIVKAYRKDIKLSQADYDAVMVELKEKQLDFLLLDKYTKIDNKIITETGLKIKKLQQEQYTLNNLINNANTELTTHTIDLKTIISAFELLNQERSDCIDNWESSLVLLTEMDNKIKSKVESSNSELESKVNLEQLLKNKETELSALELEKGRTQKEVERIERLISKCILESKVKSLGLKNLENESVLQAQESEALRKTKVETEKQHQITILKNQGLQNEIQDISLQIDDIKENMVLIRSPSKIKQVDALIQKECVKIDQMQRQFSINQQLFGKLNLELDQQQKNRIALETEILGVAAQIKNYKNTVISIENRVSDQEETLYNQEFKKLQLQRKLNILTGNLTIAENNKYKTILDQSIIRLQEQQKENLQFSKTTNKKKLDFSRIEGTIAIYIKALDTSRLDYKSKEMILNKGISVYSELLNSQAEAAVRLSLIELEISRLLTFINNKNNKLYDLESKNVDYLVLLQEKQLEMKLRKDSSRFELNAANDIKTKVLMEYNDRCIVLDNLKKKYEIILQKGGLAAMTEAEMILQLADKRNILLEKQEAIKLQIELALKDVDAMVSTVTIMQQRQSAFQENILLADIAVVDRQRKQVLCETLDSLKCDFESTRIALDDLETESEQLLTRHEHLEQALLEKETRVAVLVKDINVVNVELELQMQRKKRASDLSEKLLKGIKEKRNASDVIPEEVDIHLKKQIQIYKRLIDKIAKDLYDYENKELSRLLQELNVTLPTVTVEADTVKSTGKSESHLPKLATAAVLKTSRTTLEFTIK